MKRTITFLATLLLSASLAAQNPYEASSIIKKGNTLPSFSVEMLDGSHITTEQLRGKVVLINFWATWCPYCVEELNHISKGALNEQMKNADFVFLPISRAEKKSVVAAFVKRQGYTFDVGMDQSQQIWNKFATSAIPRNYVVDKNGKVTFVGIGYSAKDFESVKKAIDDVLK